MSTNGFSTGAEEAGQFIAEIGMLPEIHRASTDLQTAIDQTRKEIETAQFASRFHPTLSDNHREWLRSRHLTPATEAAIQAEGEAGVKRVELAAELSSIEYEFIKLMQRLVELRANLTASQEEL